MKKIDFSKIFEGAKACVTSRRFLEGWLGVAFILVISLLFFSTSLGESLRQNDMLQGAANGQEAKAFYEETGEKTCWTNSLFGGMPTFQIAPSYESTSWISTVQKIYTLGLPSPVSLLFMMMVGFYILMLALKQRWYVALLGLVVVCEIAKVNQYSKDIILASHNMYVVKELRGIYIYMFASQHTDYVVI